MLLVRLVTSSVFHKHFLRATTCEHRSELWGFSSECGGDSPLPSSAEHLPQAAAGREPSHSCRHAHWPLKRGWEAYWHGEFRAQPAAGSPVVWLLSRANRVNLIKCWVFRDINEVKKKKSDRSQGRCLLFQILATVVRLGEDSWIFKVLCGTCTIFHLEKHKILRTESNLWNYLLALLRSNLSSKDRELHGF